jgi:transcriptional regulator with XRE-family HTH domain
VTMTPDPMDIALGGAVRDLRKRKKLSQTELGEALGVSFQQIQKYERGTNRISFSALTKIAGALGCSAAYLVALVDGDEAAEGGPQSREATELVHLFSRIRSPELRQAVLNLAKAAANS